MLDLKLICEESNRVIQNLSRRGVDSKTISDICALNQDRKKMIQELEALRQKQNSVSKDIVRLKQEKKEATDELKNMKKVASEAKDLELKLQAQEAKLKDALLWVPNLLHESVPEGKTSAQNVEIRKWGKLPEFQFTPLDHEQLGEKLNLLSIKRAATLSGSRFTFLTGWGAKLERSLINFMLDINTQEGAYHEIFPPLLVNAETLTGTGQLPKFKQDLFKIENHDLYLIPTAEVPLTNFYRGEILSKDALPVQFTAYTPCFRSEAGSYGKDVRGLIRQHQFNKVEIVKIVEPEHSYQHLESLTQDAEKILQRLELPYRVVALCSADTGFGATKTYDLEVWIPSQKTYREISSCSHFEDFQARRMNLRYRPTSTAKPQYPHTLNGSALAVGRTWVAILENFQQKDGSVLIPKALQPYVGTDIIKM
ncbi:MAG: serine--tRNA ligase [Deltaproteobacteria bacterium]|nr:serine--tRNA ligase [Deltaproteobacteria bacterium]